MLQRCDANHSFGTTPEERPLPTITTYGVVNVDKPKGPTSHQVSSYVKDMLDIDKAGHGGTLDPNVTGVLPTALGRATRVNHALLKAKKTYVCHMVLHDDVKQELVEDVLAGFTGDIEQLPPVRSAIKREVRERHVYDITVLEHDGRDVLFTMECEAGTYVRKLCHDVGEVLETGAHMQDLRRTHVGSFTDASATTLQSLQEAVYLWREEGKEESLRKHILPVERGVAHLEHVVIRDSAVDSLCHGASLKVPGVVEVSESIEPEMMVAVTTGKGELVETGIAEMDSEAMVTSESGVAVTPKQVFMRPR